MFKINKYILLFAVSFVSAGFEEEAAQADIKALSSDKINLQIISRVADVGIFTPELMKSMENMTEEEIKNNFPSIEDQEESENTVSIFRTNNNQIFVVVESSPSYLIATEGKKYDFSSREDSCIRLFYVNGKEFYVLELALDFGILKFDLGEKNMTPPELIRLLKEKKALLKAEREAAAKKIQKAWKSEVTDEEIKLVTIKLRAVVEMLKNEKALNSIKEKNLVMLGLASQMLMLSEKMRKEARIIRNMVQIMILEAQVRKAKKIQEADVAIRKAAVLIARVKLRVNKLEKERKKAAELRKFVENAWKSCQKVASSSLK